MEDLANRTQDACDQLTRYGGAVFSTELADVLDVLTDINDDLCNGRERTIVIDKIDRAKAMLDAIAATLD